MPEFSSQPSQTKPQPCLADYQIALKIRTSENNTIFVKNWKELSTEELQRITEWNILNDKVTVVSKYKNGMSTIETGRLIIKCTYLE